MCKGVEIRLVTHVCGEYRILDTEFEKMLCNQCKQLLLDNYELIPDTTHHVTLTTRQHVNTDSMADVSTGSTGSRQPQLQKSHGDLWACPIALHTTARGLTRMLTTTMLMHLLGSFFLSLLTY